MVEIYVDRGAVAVFPHIDIIGQWLHKCNCQLIAHMLIKIKPFLDAHYGPVKGNHCYWFGALLLTRAAIILLISALVPADHASIVIICILASAVVLMYFGQMVYCSIAVSMFDIFFMNLALLAGTNLPTDSRTSPSLNLQQIIIL